MGLIEKLLELLFGSGRNVVRETAEIFLENREEGAARETEMRGAALAQFASEFKLPRKGHFDRFMDGLNRIPRPLMAFGTIGLCISAMVDPIWFAARMQGIALVPQPLWWLLGSIVSFYFGARFQVKSQEFQRSVAATMSAASAVSANVDALAAMKDTPSFSSVRPQTPGASAANPALNDWQARHIGGAEHE